jgi:hypothetical protein
MQGHRRYYTKTRHHLGPDRLDPSLAMQLNYIANTSVASASGRTLR